MNIFSILIALLLTFTQANNLNFTGTVYYDSVI